MSHVEFEIRLCLMSLYFDTQCFMSLSPMSHSETKRIPCPPVDFRCQGPYESSYPNLQCIVGQLLDELMGPHADYDEDISLQNYLN